MQRLEFVIDNSEDEELSELNRKKLPEFIELLLKNEYVIALRSDGCCIIVECALNPDEYGGAHLEWVEDE